MMLLRIRINDYCGNPVGGRRSFSAENALFGSPVGSDPSLTCARITETGDF
jgi:hypothetical protein